MHQPPHFREERLDIQHKLIRAHPLALLVSAGAQEIEANLIPMMLRPDIGAHGVLHCHLAKANPQIGDITIRGDVLAVFQGPENYVTPSWYPSKNEHGKVVPTWNYVIIQVHGRARLIEDAQWLRNHVTELTSQHEGTRPNPWAVTDAPERFVSSQLKGIVGVEITISRIEAKWKVSQNRSESDRLGVIQGLSGEPTTGAADMAKLVSGDDTAT